MYTGDEMMTRKYTFKEKDIEIISEARINNKDKRAEVRLHALQLRALNVPDNIRIAFIPPYTPEMNPIEQIWKEIRIRGFKNEVFQTLDKVVERLCSTINHLSPSTITSITARQWIVKAFI